MIDSGIGTMLSLLRLAKDLYSKFIKLGEQAATLAADTKTIKDQLKSLIDFLRKNSDELTCWYILKLKPTLQKCKDTISEANKAVEDSRTRGYRLKETVLPKETIARVQTKVEGCHKGLMTINQDITQSMVASISKRLRETKQYTPALDEANIPPNTPEFARALLTSGPDRDIDERDQYGYPVLYTACKDNNKLLVKTLLSHGANLSVRTRATKNTALHVAAFDSHIDILDAIKNVIKFGLALPFRADEGDLGKQSRLERGLLWRKEWVDLIGSTDIYWRMPLHYAAQRGAARVVKLLAQDLNQPIEGYENLCPVNAPDYNGRSALHLAAENGREQVVEVLLREGADPLLKDNDGQKPSDLAKAGGHTECAKLIKDEVKMARARRDEQRKVEKRQQAKKNDGGKKEEKERGGKGNKIEKDQGQKRKESDKKKHVGKDEKDKVKVKKPKVDDPKVRKASKVKRHVRFKN